MDAVPARRVGVAAPFHEIRYGLHRVRSDPQRKADDDSGCDDKAEGLLLVLALAGGGYGSSPNGTMLRTGTTTSKFASFPWWS